MAAAAFPMLFSSNPSRMPMCLTSPAITSTWTWRAKGCWSATGRNRLPGGRPVGGGSDVGLPDFHFADARAGGGEAAGDLVVKIAGHILGRRVDVVERGEIVQKLMIQAADDGAYQLFDVGEIDQQA